MTRRNIETQSWPGNEAERTREPIDVVMSRCQILLTKARRVFFSNRRRRESSDKIQQSTPPALTIVCRARSVTFSPSTIPSHFRKRWTSHLQKYKPYQSLHPPSRHILRIESLILHGGTYKSLLLSQCFISCAFRGRPQNLPLFRILNRFYPT